MFCLKLLHADAKRSSFRKLFFEQKSLLEAYHAKLSSMLDDEAQTHLESDKMKE